MSVKSEVLLGMGNSLDYDMHWRTETICARAAELGIDSWPDPPARIRDERDLLSAILAYAAAGIGTERAVDSVQAIESLAHRVGFQRSLGGTGVRAGRVVDLVGIGCTVHLTTVSPAMQALLWTDAQVISGGDAVADYPHLIVQYRDDQPLTIGGRTRTPPRPNRLIFVHDPDNSALPLSPELAGTAARNDVFLISGFNAIGEPALLSSRLADVAAAVGQMRSGTWAMYEDSGFHRPELSATALGTMAGVCDIVSMNEDEFIAHLQTPIDLDDPDVVRRGLDTLTARWNIANLVVHTARWAAAVGAEAERLRPALSEGVLAGAARFSRGDAMGEHDLIRLRSAPRSARGTAVAAGLERGGATAVAALELAPEEPVTVGLGDSFVGGFLVGLRRSAARSRRVHPARPASGNPLGNYLSEGQRTP